MSHILVVDDMAMCREPIAEALRRHGYEVTCAAGGTEALDVLRDEKLDLVLLDVTMPDPDGLAVLQIMRRNPDLKEIPVILLTDRAEQDTVSQAAQCGVQGYLLKANFSLDILLGRVGLCLGSTNAGVGAAASVASTSAPASVVGSSAAATHHAQPVTAPAKRKPTKSLQELAPIITKEKLTTLVNDGLKLKPLAATVHKVMAVTGSSGCCAADVASAVANDQALCIRLLKLANSSAYARGRPADSVQTAVQRIGVQEVRKLVMALGVFENYTETKSNRFDVRLFWEHSIACGLIAAALARECGFKAVDDCFLWGTVHDVGRIILLDHLPKEYHQVCDAADELLLPLETVEPRMLILSHTEILKHALEHWQFPHAFIAPVVYHHQVVSRLKRLGPEHAEPAMIVALANRIAHALLLGCSGNEVIYPFDDLIDALGVAPSIIEKIASTIPDETRDLKYTMLAHSANETWPDFASLVQDRLGMSIRPICDSAEPATDAFSMFLSRVSDENAVEHPNVGVIYLRDAGEAVTVFSKYKASETEAGCGSLPLLVVCAKGANKLAEPPWRDRPHAVLKTPVPVAMFLSSLQEVLAHVVEV